MLQDADGTTHLSSREDKTIELISRKGGTCLQRLEPHRGDFRRESREKHLQHDNMFYQLHKRCILCKFVA